MELLRAFASSTLSRHRQPAEVMLSIVPDDSDIAKIIGIAQRQCIGSARSIYPSLRDPDATVVSAVFLRPSSQEAGATGQHLARGRSGHQPCRASTANCVV